MRAVLPSLLALFVCCCLPAGQVVAQTQLAAELRMREDRLLFHALHAGGRVDEAVRVARRLLADAASRYGEDSITAAAWSHNLGAMLYLAERPAEAVAPLTRALALAEQRLGRQAPELVVTLRHLARAQFALGRVETAEHQLDRARQLLLQEYGVFTPEQLPLLDDLFRMAIYRRDLDAAERGQRLRQLVMRRHADGAGAAYSHQRLGDWYLSSGRYRAAMRQHRRALELLEAEGRTGMAGFRSLLSMAELRRLQGRCCAARLLQQALFEVRRDETADARALAEALLQLADRFQLLRRHETARVLYAEVGRMPDAPGTGLLAAPRPLGLGGAGDVVTAFRRATEATAVVRRLKSVPGPGPDTMTGGDPASLLVSGTEGFVGGPALTGGAVSGGPAALTGGTVSGGPAELTGGAVSGGPAALTGGPIPMCMFASANLARRPETLDELYVELRYSVDRQGSVRDARVQDTNAPPELARFVANLLARFRHQPRYEDGEPVMTPDLVLRQTFRRRPPATTGPDFSRDRQAFHQGCQLLAMRGS